VNSTVSVKGDRPRTYMSKSERRAMIVRTAKDIFSEKGFHRTSIEDICTACGIAHGTLYLHFTGKDEIFRHVVIDVMDTIQEMIRPLSSESPEKDEVDDVFTFIYQKNLRVLRAIEKNRNLLRIVFRDAPGHSREVEMILSQMFKVTIGQIETEQTVLRDMGLIREVDPRISAQLAVGTMMMVCLNYMLKQEVPDVEWLAQQVTDLQFYGYGKTGSPGKRRSRRSRLDSKRRTE
jgi:AcrR family transcriptional regulator